MQIVELWIHLVGLRLSGHLIFVLLLKHDIKWKVDGNWEEEPGSRTHCENIMYWAPGVLPVNVTVREISSYCFCIRFLTSSVMCGPEWTLGHSPYLEGMLVGFDIVENTFLWIPEVFNLWIFSFYKSKLHGVEKKMKVL